MKKAVILMLSLLTIATLFLSGCDDGDYKTGGGGLLQHYNTSNGQYD